MELVVELSGPVEVAAVELVDQIAHLCRLRQAVLILAVVEVEAEPLRMQVVQGDPE